MGKGTKAFLAGAGVGVIGATIGLGGYEMGRHDAPTREVVIERHPAVAHYVGRCTLENIVINDGVMTVEVDAVQPGTETSGPNPDAPFYSPEPATSDFVPNSVVLANQGDEFYATPQPVKGGPNESYARATFTVSNTNLDIRPGSLNLVGVSATTPQGVEVCGAAFVGTPVGGAPTASIANG
jgi:hypothetical protein